MRATTLAVLVALLPAGSLLAQGASPNIERGVTPEKAYAVSNVDVVNVFNANLNVPIPIGPSFPVSEHLSYQWSLNYGGNGWEEESTIDVIPNTGPPPLEVTYAWTFPSRLDNAGFGWRLSMGRIMPETWVGCGYPYGGSTNALAYVSPDGAVHCFANRLHSTVSGEQQTNVSFSQDGTYLRMIKDPITDTTTVEFPDGTVHEFVARFGTEANPTPVHPSNGYVTKMRDRYGNWVAIDYDATGAPTPTRNYLSAYGSQKVWHVTDSQSRDQWVYLIPTPSYAEVITNDDPGAANEIAHMSVAEIKMPAFGWTAATPVWATYLFHYKNEATAAGHTTPTFTEISRKCASANVYSHLGNMIRVPLLESVEMPEGVQYSLVNDLGTSGQCTGTTGTLSSMTLPTGATVDWTYQFIEYPANSASKYNHKTGPPPINLTSSVGVKQRSVTESSALGGALLERRTYDVDAQYLPETSKHLIITVTDLVPGSASWLHKTKNYFTICDVNCADTAGRGLYGLPVTRETSDPADSSLFLSTITYDTAGTEMQKTYMKHEADIPLADIPVGHTGYNRRSNAQRTYHLYTGGSHYVDTQSSDFDGYGHYRTVTSSASFDTNTRTTTTAYKGGTFHPGDTTFTIFAKTAPWLPSLYDRVDSTHTDGAATQTTSRVDYCFDTTTGFLTGKRTARKTSKTLDLLTIYRDVDAGASDGNVSYEASYGGDSTPLSTTSGCADPGGTAPFTLKYSYSNGTRSVTETVGLTFKSSDFVIDATGLPTTAKHGNLNTTFVYDALGRLTSVSPAGRASAQYTYDLASRPVSMTLKRLAVSGGTTLTEARYYYDGLGRLIQRRQSMPSAGNPWSAAGDAYDGVGRKLSTTVSVAATSGSYSALSPSTPKTSIAYDALDRVVSTTAPDGQTATAAYKGVQQVDRTENIATSAGALSAVQTTEYRDALGRLSSVLQNQVTANYRYDVRDLLRRVDLSSTTAGNQNPRIFTYDTGGLLSSEQHPESGVTSYPTYDARGQLKEKRPADCRFDLNYTYDPAGRITVVSQHQNPYDCTNPTWVPIKEYVYGDVANATDHAFGKLQTSKRHNRNSFGDILVSESYRYLDAAERLTEKTTSITEMVSNTPMQTFTQRYASDDLDQVTASEYPTCGVAPCGQAPHQGVTRVFQKGFLTEIHDGIMTPSGDLSPGVKLAGMTYDKSGFLTEIAHSNAVTDTITADPSGMPRPVSIAFSGFAAGCTAPTVSLTPSGTDLTVSYGQTMSWTATATGTGPLTYEWHRVANNVETFVTGSASYTTPAVTGYEEYWLIVRSSCGNAESAHVTVRGIPNAPSGVTALRNGATGVNVQWTGVTGAETYRVERSTSVGNFILVGVTTGTSLPDGGCAAGKACVYQVFAVSHASITSAPSNKDLVTMIDFSPTGAYQPVRATHFAEILTAINAIRDTHGDIALTWSQILPGGPAAPAVGVVVDSRHLTALRTAMTNALSAFGIASAAYDDPSPAGFLIRYHHLDQLRERSQ